MLIRNGICQSMPSRFDADEDTLLIVDSEQSLMDVTRLTGDPDHAAALIERSLRSQGALDAEGVVLTHELTAKGPNYDVLFTAYASSWWRDVQAWAAGQQHQVALVPVLALLWQSLGKSQGLVYRNGSRFIFLANDDGTPLIESAQAFSDANLDLASTTSLFGEMVKARLTRDTLVGTTHQEISSVTWYCTLSSLADSAPSEATLALQFSQCSGLRTSLAPYDEVLMGDAFHCTCLPALARHFSTRLMSNSGVERAALLAKQASPIVSVLAAVVGCAAIAHSGFNWYQSHQHSKAAASALVNAQSLEAQVKGRAESQKLPDSFSDTAALVDRLAALLDRPDPNSLAATLKNASANGVRVVRLYTTAPTAAEASKSDKLPNLRVLVDAVVEPKAGASEQIALARFVAALQRDGYVATAVDTPARGARVAGSGPVLSYELKRKVAEGAAK